MTETNLALKNIGDYVIKLLQNAEHNSDIGAFIIPEKDVYNLQQYLKGLTGRHVIPGQAAKKNGGVGFVERKVPYTLDYDNDCAND